MAQDTPNAPHPALRRRRFVDMNRRVGSMGLPIKTISVIAGLLLALILVIVLGAAFVVNRLQNQLATTAREETARLSEEARREIERVLAENKATSLADVVNHPDVRLQLRILTREGGVVMAAIAGQDGNVLIQQYGSDEIARRVAPEVATRVQGILPQDKDLVWDLSVTPMPPNAERQQVPIKAEGRTIGYLEYGLESEKALQRMESISTQITHSLGAMVAVISLILAATIYLLYKVFARHLALQRSADEAEHFAHIGTLASGLAHEIRNPLHAMNLHLEVAREDLEEGGSGNAHAARIVATVQGQVESLNHTLSHFLSYALPKNLDRERVPLDVLVNDVLALLQPELARRAVTVAGELPPGAEILADQSALRQVITNIILNAAQIMDGSPRRELAIGLALQRGEWLLTVDDTGPGIPPGEEERIFEPFVSHRQGGTGFGLAIARRIIEEHGGRLWGANRPGGGARFTIALRAAPPAAAEAPAQQGAVTGIEAG